MYVYIYISLYILIIFYHPYIHISILIIFYHPYIHISILIIIYHPILTTICTLCEAPEINNIDSGAIQKNCIIIIINTNKTEIE